MKVHLMSHPLLCTEWLSLKGHKYLHLPDFNWEIVDSPEDADVLVWDGVLSPKAQANLKYLKSLASSKVLLLQGESRIALAQHDYVKLFELDGVRYVELQGWSVLPELLIEALKQCYQKLGHAKSE
jgi:Ni,Fe-hydrogenase III small subunit